MTNQPVPGWYPDPEAPGYQRYWNGQTWGDDRQPIAGATSGVTAPGTNPYQPMGMAQPRRTIRDRFDPEPNNPDSISMALGAVKACFWRLLGLIAIAFSGSFVLNFIGTLIFSEMVSSSSSNWGFDSRGNSVFFSSGPSAASVIFGVFFAAIFWGAAILLFLWIIAAVVKVVREHQRGMTTRVGPALLETWPRAWRFSVLALAGLLILAVFLAIAAVIQASSVALGVIMLLVFIVAAVVFYTVMAGLYAWLISPTRGELAGNPGQGTA